MKLLKLKEIDSRDFNFVFKQSSFSSLSAFIFILALTGGMIYLFKNSDEHIPIFITIFLSSFMFLFAYFFFRAFIRSLSPSNWLVGISYNGFFIKFRSYLNSHFPDDDFQVIFIPFDEISYVKRFDKVIKYETHTKNTRRGGKVTEKFTYLDIFIKAQVLKELKLQLKYERDLRVPKKATSLHYPVSVIENKIIRVEFNNKNTSIVPKIDTLLKICAKYSIDVKSCYFENSDYTNKDILKNSNMEDKIIELLEHGNDIAAIKIAMTLYDMNVTQAKFFIDDFKK